MGIVDEIIESFKKGSVITRLIYVNVGVFVFVRLVNVFFALMNKEFALLEWLAVPSDLNQLIAKPWTLVSYMFLHFDFLHIIFNMLWLFWLGKIFMFYFDGRKLLGVYLLGGLSGGVFYLLAYNLFPAFSDLVSNSILLGASASVIAIVIAVAIYAPNHTISLLFIGDIKLKYIALISIFFSVIGMASSNAGGNLAHLGGAFMGMIYVIQYRKGRDYTKGINLLLNGIGQFFKPGRKIKVSYKRGKSPDIEYNKSKNLRQEEINKILEKISKSGYNSLSKEEKEFLFKMGSK